MKVKQQLVEYVIITKNEFLILNVAIEKQVIQASDINSIFAGKASSEVSRQIRKLVEKKKMLQPISDNARKYIMRFDNNFLLRGVIKSLGDNGFIALKD